MKQAGYSKRPHGRSLERQRQSHSKQPGNLTESKMKGSPQQWVEKYLTLARDATSSGDPVSAENYYQYADHYYRLVAASRISRMPRPETKKEKTEVQVESVLAPPPTSSQSNNLLE